MEIPSASGNGPETGRPTVGVIVPDPYDPGFEIFRLSAWFAEWGAGVDVRHASLGKGGRATSAAYLDDLTETGPLHEAARGLAGQGCRHISFACTSAGFYRGMQAAHAQAEALSEACGVPCTSTAIDLFEALRSLDAAQVDVLSVYLPPVGALFARVMAESGVAVRRFDAVAIPQDKPPHAFDMRAAILGLPDGAGDVPLVVPSTAVSTLRHLPELERRLGRTIVTANAVTALTLTRAAGALPRVAAAGTVFQLASG